MSANADWVTIHTTTLITTGAIVAITGKFHGARGSGGRGIFSVRDCVCGTLVRVTPPAEHVTHKATQRSEARALSLAERVGVKEKSAHDKKLVADVHSRTSCNQIPFTGFTALRVSLGAPDHCSISREPVGDPQHSGGLAKL